MQSRVGRSPAQRFLAGSEDEVGRNVIDGPPLAPPCTTGPAVRARLQGVIAMTKLTWFAVIGAAATQLVACVGSDSEDPKLEDAASADTAAADATPEPARQAEQPSVSSAQEQAVDDGQPGGVEQSEQPIDASTDETTGETDQ